MIHFGKLSTVIALGAFCAMASAATIPLGSSNWQANWDNTLNPYVNIVVNAETSDTIRITKHAEFIQGPDIFGQFPTIPITFQQIGASTLTKIIIEDEVITNSTGVPWTDFHFDILDHGQATFEQTGFLFATSPLNNQSVGATTVSVDGFGLGPNGSNAVVLNGQVWYPGLSAGELVINVVSQQASPLTTFILKETPTPEPTTLGLLAIGALAMIRRRR